MSQAGVGSVDNGRVPSSSQWVAFPSHRSCSSRSRAPSLLFTIGRALTVGRREALLSVVGNGFGLVTQVIGVAFGSGCCWLLARPRTAWSR